MELVLISYVILKLDPYFTVMNVIMLQVFGRQVAQAHLRACLYAGIKIYGTNGERMASQVNKIYFAMILSKKI